MSPALRRLLWLETRGQLRLAWSRLQTRRGLVIAGAFAFFLVILATGFALSPGQASELGVGTAGFRRWSPLGLWALIALGLLSPRGLYFKPAEVAMLFPAPLSRRDLVLFNVVSRARMGVLSSLWLAAFPALRGRSFVAAFVGYFFCVVLLQVTAQCFAVGRLWLASRPALRWTLAASLAALALLLMMTRDLAWLAPALWLTRPFVEALVAESFGALLAWSAAAAGILAALVAALCAMDVAYLEAALSGSRKASEQRARARSGGAFAALKPSLGFRVPHFPRLSGAGPIAWRQCMEAVRNPRGALLVLFVALMGAAVVGLTSFLGRGPDDTPPLLLPSLSLSMIFASTLLTGDNLAFDFRRDLDRMPMLKALPVSSLAICAGQVAAATLFVTAIQAVGVVIVIAVADVFELATMLWLVVLLPLANWSAIAIENALFLAIPYRTVAEDPADVAFVGRLMLSMVLKVTTIAAVAGSGAAFGWLAGSFLGSFALGALAAGVWLAAACVPLTLLVAHAFDRFDVARDIPA